jgi:hypothetical protein
MHYKAMLSLLRLSKYRTRITLREKKRRNQLIDQVALLHPEPL